MHSRRLWISVLAVACGASAIGQDSCVSFKASTSTFTVASEGVAAPILLSSDEWPGVQRTAFDFALDIERVTGLKPALSNVTASSVSAAAREHPPIIVGTLGKSSLIDQVVNNTKLDVSSIKGQWESFITREVSNPLPGIKTAYVVIGSDKRGTIFALYDHSEQFGVSPWYWWADVPVTTHSELFVASNGCSHGPPSVKYRGIFLNDEQPALTNWAMEKFTNGTGAWFTNSPFNHVFYTKLFELLLRMKANYLWPAIWSRRDIHAFNVDDPQNQPLADWWGIVMGTSHQEPMMRGTPIEFEMFATGDWNYTTNSKEIYEFWVNGTIRAKPYESIFTIGMRGAGDLPLSETENIDLLEQIVSDQRQILTDVFNGTDVSTIPQLWCLYQEVQGYYEDGMRVPDDVTLLWADDNWGNIRHFPTLAERNRTGGAGVYYHFDLVAGPRDFKWVTSTQISKTYEQMSLAIDRDASRIWIVNVGDLKPYEMDTEFFIAYGWDADKWNRNNLNDFVTRWAQREFALNQDDALEVSDIIANLTRFNARRKPELWNSTTYSLTNYREAEAVLDQWQTLSDASNKIYNKLSSAKQPAFFQLVQHPVQASFTLANMWIASGINALRAEEARLSANEYDDQVTQLFEQDYEWEHEYHSILNGKWDHMMDQTHVMYYYWQQPMANTKPMTTRVQSKKQALAGVMRVSPEGFAAPGDMLNQCSLGYNCPAPTVTLDPFTPAGNRFVDIGAAGPNSFTFTVSTNATWLAISTAKGSISTKNTEERIFLTPDWSKISGVETAQINFTATSSNQPALAQSVIFVANNTGVPSGFKGFVEGDGGVSIEAAHASRNTTVEGLTWVELPGIGRTLSGITPWPRGGEDRNFTAGTGPSIEYDFYTFNSINGNGNISVRTYVNPSLNAFGPDRPVAVAIQVDSQPAQTSYFIPPAPSGSLPAAWDGADGFVANSIVSIITNFAAPPGAHTLKIWMVEPTVVVQKIVIDTGGVQSSYLGPPESIRV
ncbi:hypothetical protein EIP91_011982 [Steccherinum ochraceum]|uniref:Gylcosyl hydrolase 115 C-terminal domain-containing protein n=1 Tax=Steccherinum ochraceum TaxID=92696 RepID=A0A4R0RH00_9APHY|nr:hypothetical protein EIP91_011982 [Steccherinum ochraceum]